MIRKGFTIIKPTVSHHCTIKVEASCQPMQEYDTLSGEYYPERTGAAAVPLVIAPDIGYTENGASVTGTAAASRLTNGHWYRFDNTSGSGMTAANEITSGTMYTIDTVVGSPTYGRLTIRENVAPGNPVTYLFTGTLTTDGGNVIAVSASHQAKTRAIEKEPVFTLDNATEVLYNPLEDADAYSINPVLKPAIPGAVFEWQSLHNDQWGAVCATPLDWAVDKVGNGIKVSRHRMQDQLKLRCNAKYTAGGKQHTQTIVVSLTRRFPEYWVNMFRVGNVKPGTTSISPRAIIETAKGVLTDLKGEMSITWYNAANGIVAYGLQPVIPLSALGTTLEVGFQETDLGGWKALVDSDGAFIVDSDGALILVK